MIRPLFIALALAALASCGGDAGNDDYRAALQQASDKQAEAVALAPASPCSTDQHCASLAFSIPNGHCVTQAYHPYTLLAPTAGAAETAAAEERAAAAHAVAIAPPPMTACTASIIPPPNLVCSANACKPG